MAERAVAERAVTVWTLSPRERAIQKMLGKTTCMGQDDRQAGQCKTGMDL